MKSTVWVPVSSFAGYFFFQVPSNLALARVGARKWIAVIMVVWGIISASMIFVATPRGFYVLRFLLGAAEAGFFPGMILYLRRWFPSAARARAIALFMTAAPLAGVVGGPLSGLLLGVHGSPSRGMAMVISDRRSAGGVLGGVVLAYLTDRPEIATWLAEDERSWLVAAAGAGGDAASPGLQRMLSRHCTSARVWILVVVYLGETTAAYGIGLWLPSLLRNVSGTSNFVIGLLSAIPYLATMVGHGAGRHSLRSNAREEVASRRIGVCVRDRFRLRGLLHFDHRGRRLPQRDLDGGIFHERAVLGHDHRNAERDLGRRRHCPD